MATHQDEEKDPYREEPEHKAMQDHSFGTTASKEMEEAERLEAEGASAEEGPQERTEPNAWGKA